MRKFVGQREHVGGLGVGPIDEYDWCQVVSQRESTKLGRIEWSVRIVANDATDHDMDTLNLEIADEVSQCVPSRLASALGPQGRS